MALGRSRTPNAGVWHFRRHLRWALLAMLMLLYAPQVTRRPTSKYTVPASRPEHNAIGVDGAGVYINLLERTDRKSRIEAALEAATLDYRRIDGARVRADPTERACWGNKYCASQVGCQLSHMRALRYAMEEGLSSVMVFEDDFEWLPHVDVGNIKEVFRNVQKEFKDWDVIALSLNVLKSTPTKPALKVHVGNGHTSNVVRIQEAQATHGYIVRGRYIAVIYDAFRSCDVLSAPLTAIDTCWKPLQKKGKWFALSPQVAKQARGFSDIEGVNVSYNIS